MRERRQASASIAEEAGEAHDEVALVGRIRRRTRQLGGRRMPCTPATDMRTLPSQTVNGMSRSAMRALSIRFLKFRNTLVVLMHGAQISENPKSCNAG
ncbi:hypothetical protein [uncultured Massilia sp.]|uniref:hypothetical protein n=1 Tax=uncultured Massilia sp. TaxID=169973 RepID=UPI0025F21D9B|nr:hypothetical protein [uncultured Massilia sp.]